MAIDSYMYFQDYNKNFLVSESQVKLSRTIDPAEIYTPFGQAAAASGVFEVEDYSFDIEQTLNIGSQSSGAGAGKVGFNPFSITRKIDCSSPILYQMACSGTPFMNVGLGLRKSSGAGGTNLSGAGSQNAGVFFLCFTFKLVAVKTISWAHDDESPKETTTFEYGALDIQYAQQLQNGTFKPVIFTGWNKIQNTADQFGANIGTGSTGG